MPLSVNQNAEIEQLLKEQIRRKMDGYSPETNNMPFHVRLLGRDKMALFSFIQSVNTSLGTSVFEQVAAIIAKPNFRQAVNQYTAFNNTISPVAQHTIQQIMDDLRASRSKPDKQNEIRKILSVAQNRELLTVRRPRIDLFLEDNDGTEYYFDLKSAKPNMEEIVGYKRKILEWVAMRGAVNSNVKLFTGLAIPYNPYEPEPYARWTFKGLFDLPFEIKVAEEFWDFLGGEKTYEELLGVFEKVGMDLRPEIDNKFSSITQ